MKNRTLCALTAMGTLAALLSGAFAGGASAAQTESQILGKICIVNTVNGARFQSQIIKHGNAYYHRSIDVSGNAHDARIHFNAKGLYNYPWVSDKKVDAQELYILSKGSIEIRTEEATGVLRLTVVKGDQNC